jgi:hypothetical protein
MKYLLSLLLVLPVFAQESFIPATPVVRTSNVIHLSTVLIDLDERAVRIVWTDNTGERGSAQYTTPAPMDHPSQPTGQTLITTLNTANLSTNSLVKRVLQRLQTDGYLPTGSVTGAPQ